MARIRSLFPTQWTDEDFVSCSAFARLLALGLRNEADDQGIFEWKPVSLKMRLLPADHADVAELLAELSENRQVVRFEVDGKAYGAIRNFMRYQRPKKPRPVHPITPEVEKWVGKSLPTKPGDEELDGDDEAGGSVPVPHQYGTGSENHPQREEGGGRRKEITNPLINSGVGLASASAPANNTDPEDLIGAFDAAIEAAWGAKAKRRKPHATDYQTAQQWSEAGLTAEIAADVFRIHCEKMQARPGGKPPWSLACFDGDVRRALAASASVKAAVECAESSERLKWRNRLTGFRDGKPWMPIFGSKPGERDCEAPPDLVREILGDEMIGAAR